MVRFGQRGDFAVSSDLAFVLATDDDLTPNLAHPRTPGAATPRRRGPRKNVGARLDPPVKLATVVTYLNRICRRYQENGRDVTTSQDAIRAAVADGWFDYPGPAGRADRLTPTW